jgi:hypothetical protein
MSQLMRHGSSKTLLWKPQISQREEILPKSKGWCGVPDCGSRIFYGFRAADHDVIFDFLKITLNFPRTGDGTLVDDDSFLDNCCSLTLLFSKSCFSFSTSCLNLAVSWSCPVATICAFLSSSSCFSLDTSCSRSIIFCSWSN